MGVANSFAPIASNRFTRKWGGSNADGVDPYISGYFFVHFAYLPPKLGDQVKDGGGNDGISRNDEIQSVLHSSCLAVTLPGGTVNKAEFTGLGGVKWSAPTNVDWDNTVTLRFLEFSTLPILSIMHGWVRLIRDYRSGTTPLVGAEGAYTKSEYSGTMYYYSTKPDGLTIESYACLTGMFPMKDPMDQYGGDLATYDKLEVDIDFSVDYVWRQPWVKQRCQSLAETVYNDKEGVVYKYGENEPSA